MIKNALTFVFAFLFLSFGVFSQNDLGVYFSLQQLPDQSWGVFVSPEEGLVPSGRLLTGSGQVTIVADEGFDYVDFKNYGGTWGENARVVSPAEAGGRAYISFGLLNDMPKVQLLPQERTLLFSFIADVVEGQVSLFDNNEDPFAAPNSRSCNPGNEIAIADLGNGGVRYYGYKGNDLSVQQSIFAKYKQEGEEGRIEEMAIQWLDDEEEK